jgi:YidC/Oxa1 family membrane protein insertase
LGDIWNAAIVSPLTNALVALYGMLGSYGLAIIVLTFAIKIITFPLTLKQIQSTKGMRDIQPHLEELKKKYGKDRQKMTEETMRLYKEHGVNPAMGCLPLLIQMPIWFGLYHALITLANESPEFQRGFLWLPSLAQPDPFYLLVVLTVISQYAVQKMMTVTSTDPQQQMMAKVMMIMPFTFGFIAMQVPSGLVLYWVTTNVFTFFQQLVTMGWGDLRGWQDMIPGMSSPKTVAHRTQRAKPAKPVTATVAAISSNGTAEADEAGETGDQAAEPRTPKAAKHKKRSGARSTRGEKKDKR